jgi:hypothetical protein
MKKKLLIVIGIVILFIMTHSSLIWCFVEFVTYLSKDTPFNWWSVYSVVTSYSILVIYSIFLKKILVEK